MRERERIQIFKLREEVEMMEKDLRGGVKSGRKGLRVDEITLRPFKVEGIITVSCLSRGFARDKTPSLFMKTSPIPPSSLKLQFSLCKFILHHFTSTTPQKIKTFIFLLICEIFLKSMHCN